MIVDARGLACPLPILRARKALGTLPDGGLLTVLATDPASLSDFPAFCRQTGHAIVEQTVLPDGVFSFVLRRAPEIGGIHLSAAPGTP
jgi:tRNA 2-thiouridine synthesizing protein A